MLLVISIGLTKDSARPVRSGAARARRPRQELGEEHLLGEKQKRQPRLPPVDGLQDRDPHRHRTDGQHGDATCRTNENTASPPAWPALRRPTARRD